MSDRHHSGPQPAASRPGALFPVSLALEGRSCLVVGGGPVAARKVQALLECGARVTVVAPQVTEWISTLASRPDTLGSGCLAVEERPYLSPEASGYRLVITATGIPAVDHAVWADAEGAGVWVNSADDVANCTFLLPAVHRQGPVTVAVSTGGSSPALAGWLRNRVAEAVGPDVAILAELLEEARNRIKDAGGSTESFDWITILDEQVVPMVRQGRIVQARTLLGQLTRPPATR